MPFYRSSSCQQKKNPLNATYAKQVVTYRTKLGHFLIFFFFLFSPERPRFPCTQTHARTRGRSDSPFYHPHRPSPHYHRCSRCAFLTVQGVSGDLTSHGGMQGALFTFLSRRELHVRPRRSAARPTTFSGTRATSIGARGADNRASACGIRVRDDGGESVHPAAAAAASWPLAPGSRRDCHGRWCWRWSFRGL